MKKLLAILMALMLVFSLAGCFFSRGNAVMAYLDSHSEELITEFENAFESSSGMDCTCDIEVEGNGFVIDVNIQDLDDVSQDIKDSLQDAYDSMDSSFEAMLDTMQEEVPELEYFTFNINDKDGDLLATVKAGD